MVLVWISWWYIKKTNSPLFLISLVFQMTSPQTLLTRELSQRLNVLGHWALLQVSPAHFTLFVHELATTVILESCHSLKSLALHKCPGDFLKYLGHNQHSDMEPARIWWVFWVQLTLFPFLLCSVWLLLLLAPPSLPSPTPPFSLAVLSSLF